MRLDVVGSAGSYPSPDSACSSYLLRSGTSSVLLDAGNGSQSRLYRLIEPANLSAIVISHGHVDHFADLIGIYHYLKYASPPKAPVPVFTTEDTRAKLECLLGTRNIDETVITLNVAEPGDTVAVGSLSMRFYEARHSVPTLITRISDNSSVMCYGADGDICEELSKASSGVDLLLGESTWVERTEKSADGLHLDARRLAALAKSAGAIRLVITHVAYPAEKARIHEIVTDGYPGAAYLAEDGASFSF